MWIGESKIECQHRAGAGSLRVTRKGAKGVGAIF